MDIIGNQQAIIGRDNYTWILANISANKSFILMIVLHSFSFYWFVDCAILANLTSDYFEPVFHDLNKLISKYTYFIITLELQFQ
jgi:hypothetical protein